MGIFKRFMRYFAKNTIKKAEDYKTPCNPNAHWDRKRCKSCECFTQHLYNCLCDHGNRIDNPWQKACGSYKKRKIKARDLKYGKRSA